VSDCDVCNDFSLLQKATCDEKSYRWGVLKSLCYLIELLSTEEASAVTVTNILPQVVKTAVQVEASYAIFATVGLISSVKKLNSIRVVNNTDADLDFSYDGGASTAFTVLAGTIYTEAINITLSTTTALQMKKGTGETASNGSVYIEGRYNS
jgi:hypothetical protein